MSMVARAITQITESPTAEHLTAVVTNILKGVVKLPDDQLATRLIGIATDGAAVMVGQRNGLTVSLRRTIAPWMVSIHCAAHRLNLSAGVLKRDGLVSSITAVLEAANSHFCKSPQRVNMLRKAADSIGVQHLAVLRLIPTRWLCILPVLERLLTILPALLVYSSESPDADALFVLLTNFTIITAAKALLPLLQALNHFCLACQVRGIFAGELCILYSSMVSSINRMYIAEQTAYTADSFPDLNAWLDVGNAARTPLVYSNSETAVQESSTTEAGTPFEPAADSHLCFRLAVKEEDGRTTEQLVPMQAREPPTGQRGRPRPASAVTPALLERVVCYIKQQISVAAQAVLEDLGSRFDNMPLLAAAQVLLPATWVHSSPDQEHFKRDFDALQDYFCKEGKCVVSSAATTAGSSLAASSDPCVAPTAATITPLAASMASPIVGPGEGGSSCLGVPLTHDKTYDGPLDLVKLKQQRAVFFDLLSNWVKDNPPPQPTAVPTAQEGYDAAEKVEGASLDDFSDMQHVLELDPSVSYTTRCYRSLFAGKPAISSSVSEWLKLAEAIFVIVPVSVEEERMFSAMKFIKNHARNRLGGQHLSACARAFTTKGTLASRSMLEESIRAWHAAAQHRGRYAGQAQKA
jgi:hypothetical protein